MDYEPGKKKIPSIYIYLKSRRTAC